jgi:hypothetical protein
MTGALWAKWIEVIRERRLPRINGPEGTTQLESHRHVGISEFAVSGGALSTQRTQGRSDCTS